MKVRDVCIEALEEFNLTSPFEQEGGADSDLALRIFLRMMDGFNAERLMIYQIAAQVFTLTASTNDFTLGPGGTWNTGSTSTRPVKIEAANLVDSTSPAQRVPIAVMDRQWWASIPIRAQDGQPAGLYYEPAFPLGTLHLYPRSNGQYDQIELFLWQPFTTAEGSVTLSTTLSLPPGYRECVHYNLAMRLAGPFGVEVTPTVAELARASKARVKSLNSQAPRISTEGYCDPRDGSYSSTDFETRNY